MIGGKVMMDRNCPDGVRDTAQSAYDDTKALFAAWDGRGECFRKSQMGTKIAEVTKNRGWGRKSQRCTRGRFARREARWWGERFLPQP